MRRIAWLITLTLLAAACDSNDATTASSDVSDTSTASPEPDITTPEPDTAAPEPDTAAPEPSCNPITNTGCDEGQKCIYGSTDAKVCAPAGDTPGGAPCQDTSECAEGMCLSINGTDSYCYTFCKTIGHCPDNAPCMDLSDAPYSVCEIANLYDTCNILAQDCEDSSKACYSIAGESQPVCLPAGAEALGGVCEGPSDCAPGLHCVNFRCYELCNKNDPEACGLFVDCAGFVAAGVGYCDEQQ